MKLGKKIGAKKTKKKIGVTNGKIKTMPFKSEAQRRFMYKNHPDIAKKWEQEEKWDKTTKSLPERLAPKGYWKRKDRKR
jgi:hypothetical protein